MGGQVGRPNRARRAPKRDLTGQGRPQEGERSRQASQVRSKVARRSVRGLGRPLAGGGGVYLALKGGTALGCPPLGLLGKGRDRGQGRLVEGERGRERERDRQRPPSETMMLYLAL